MEDQALYDLAHAIEQLQNKVSELIIKLDDHVVSMDNLANETRLLNEASTRE